MSCNMMLGSFIEQIDCRAKNADHKYSLDDIVGISSVTKSFVPTKANLIDVSVDSYKIVPPGCFAYNPNTARMGDKVCIALNNSDKDLLVSSIYPVFRITSSEVCAEFLLLWFKRSEFDRHARFLSHGSAREVLDWDRLCEINISVPNVSEQMKIIQYYNVIENRIGVLNKINATLDTLLMTIYQNRVENNPDINEEVSLDKVCHQITDGKHGDCESEDNSGFYFISVKDISNGGIDFRMARQITKNDFEDAHKRTKLETGDILFTNSGTLGKMCLITSEKVAAKTTFQKSVAIIKPNHNMITSRILYLSLFCNKEKLIEYAHGSAQLNLLLGDMRAFKIKYISTLLQQEIEKIIAPIFDQLQQNRDEIDMLVSLRELITASIFSIGA